MLHNNKSSQETPDFFLNIALSDFKFDHIRIEKWRENSGNLLLVLECYTTTSPGREFIRGPEVPSSSQVVGVEQDQHHHLHLQPHKYHHNSAHGTRLSNDNMLTNCELNF